MDLGEQPCDSHSLLLLLLLLLLLVLPAKQKYHHSRKSRRGHGKQGKPAYVPFREFACPVEHSMSVMH